MAGLLPFTVGALAGYGNKKTGDNFYGEQALAGGVSTCYGAIRVLGNEASHMVRATHLLAIPVVVGMVLGVGNMMGRMVYDVRNTDIKSAHK